MTLPFSLFLALKYLKPKRTFLSVVTVLATLGVLLGVAVLVIVLSVMTGFDEMWRDKILDFNAHITVSVAGGLGEEEDSLCEQLEAVPGVTAAAGVAAYAGIPLTHRDHAHSVVFTTGFLKDGALDLDWPLLAHRGQTLVIYMGVSRLAEICAQLVAHGLPATTPVAVIERGTTHAQRIVKAELATLADEVLRAGIRPPSLTIVGDVVKLYPRLSWFQPEAPPAASPLPHAGCAVVHTSREP